MKTFVVIPAYNEASVIRDVIRELNHLVDRVVVVDDGSSDDTSVYAKSEGATVLTHGINRGYGAALHTGSIWSINNGADIIIHFDADGQHSPKDIPLFVHALTQGEYEVALGSRFLEGTHSRIPLSRKVVLRLALLFTRVVQGIKVTDTHNGFRAFTAKAYTELGVSQDKMAYASEVLRELHAKQLRFTEIPTTIRYSEYSRAKGQSWYDAFRIVWQLVRGRIFR